MKYLGSFCITAILACSSGALFSQDLHLTVFSGIANYKGDLQYNARSGKQISFKQARFSAGVGLAKELSPKLYARCNLTIGKVHADDKKQPGQQQRNLNFTSSVLDLMLGGEYWFIDPYEHRLTPHIFAGIAFFHFNPYTEVTPGQKVFLKPLNTEGEGIVPGKVPYALTQLSIPFGGGLKFSISDNVRAGIEISLRKTFTDYLDDVGDSYADQNTLLTGMGQQSVDLAYRGDEVGAGPYPAGGTARGTLDAKDWYYFTGLTLSFRLGSGEGSGGRRSSRKEGCPVLRR